jgi:hypothetical protein
MNEQTVKAIINSVKRLFLNKQKFKLSALQHFFWFSSVSPEMLSSILACSLLLGGGLFGSRNKQPATQMFETIAPITQSACDRPYLFIKNL